MPDDLYIRYLTAARQLADHQAECPACRAEEPCPVARPLQDRFARLQDAYLQRTKR
ncbi:hypothetical protein ABT354_36050 [Streptomyces sp. NPDC000594]|uniref:hypothetical protein n=1 Tax=Streptomyces sp. NPDC000594 TaxID=3154261 RepID=UPI00332E13BA